MAQLLSNLPVGAAVKFGMHQVGTETAQSIIWVVADKNHAGYPSNSVTLLAQKIIDLRAYDATESGFAVGNPNYALSNVHQWLNSSAASNWYTATHANDVAPTNSTTGRNTGYQSRAGFLYKFTSYERNAILPTSLKIITGSTTNNITANVFIPSVGEVLGTGNGSDGSSRFSYFSSRSVWTTLTTQAFNNTSSSYKPEDTSKTWDYWSRNASASKVTGISSTGITFDADAYNGSLGVRPALNLSATTKISDGTDGDGCYLVYENKMPTISGANTDMGNVTDDFSISYTVSDGDNEPVTVTEYIDNVMIRSYVATLGATEKLEVSGVTWLKMVNGVHTLKIVATDGFDTDTRVYTFRKAMNKIVVKRKTPIESATRPSKIIVTLVKNIPAEALVNVEVCNNGFDSSPVWEKMASSSISAGLPYEFTNNTCTAGKWGVNVRVTVDRNGGAGACYITEIGGNFE